MITNKNTKKVSLRNYFKITAPHQMTATMPVAEDLDYGLNNVVLEFSNTSTKTVNVILNFLFANSANDFYLKNIIILANDLVLDNLPINVGTVIDMDYVFDTEENFLAFEKNFIADNSLKIKFK